MPLKVDVNCETFLMDPIALSILIWASSSLLPQSLSGSRWISSMTLLASSRFSFQTCLIAMVWRVGPGLYLFLSFFLCSFAKAVTYSWSAKISKYRLSNSSYFALRISLVAHFTNLDTSPLVSVFRTSPTYCLRFGLNFWYSRKASIARIFSFLWKFSLMEGYVF